QEIRLMTPHCHNLRVCKFHGNGLWTACPAHAFRAQLFVSGGQQRRSKDVEFGHESAFQFPAVTGRWPCRDLRCMSGEASRNTPKSTKLMLFGHQEKPEHVVRFD